MQMARIAVCHTKPERRNCKRSGQRGTKQSSSSIYLPSKQSPRRTETRRFFVGAAFVVKIETCFLRYSSLKQQWKVEGLKGWWSEVVEQSLPRTTATTDVSCW